MGKTKDNLLIFARHVGYTGIIFQLWLMGIYKDVLRVNVYN